MKTYRILYQDVTADDLAVLRAVDGAILEPRFVTREMAADLRAARTLTFGYLSVMETPTWNGERYDRLRADDFWEEDGVRVHFPAWDSYLMDLRSPHYRSLLLEEVERHVLQKNMDGLFLDTVGDLTEYMPAGHVREEMQAAYRDLLDEIVRRAPALKLLQNRGFDSLPYVGAKLYGLLWEDWRGDLVRDEWVRLRLEMLARWQRSGMHVLTVSADPQKVHAKSARERGFVHLTCAQGYHTLQGQA